MSKLTPPIGPKLPEPTAEQARAAHHTAIVALQSTVGAGLKTIPNVELPDATAVPIAHGLGRAPACVLVSAPRGTAAAGCVNEVRDASTDRRTAVVLKASGFGGTITVDIMLA